MNWQSLFTKEKEISAEQARTLLESPPPGSLQLIDVRQPREYEEGHLPGLSRSQSGHLSDDQRAVVALEHASEAPDDLVQAKAGSHGVAQIIYRRTRP